MQVRTGRKSANRARKQQEQLQSISLTSPNPGKLALVVVTYFIISSVVAILCKKIDEVPQLAGIAMKLKAEFRKLLISTQESAEHLNFKRLKLYIRSAITENLRNVLKSIHQYISLLDKVTSIEELLDFLVDHCFIGYLNYTLLKEISDLTNDSELKEKFNKYEEEYRTLLRASSFNCLMEVFKSYPDLSPTTAVGLPEMILRLDSPWNEESVHTWEEYFNKRFPWADSVAAKEYSTNCILITYAILPSVLADVMRDLTNPAIITELKDNGVTIVQLPQEKGIV